MFFKRASITLSYHKHGPVLITSFNSAREFGGVIYYRDNPTFLSVPTALEQFDHTTLSNCFLQFQKFLTVLDAIIVSRNDSAEREGNFMFGGLMDRCRFQNLLTDTIGDRISI